MDLGVRAMLGASLQERYGGISGSVPEGLCVGKQFVAQMLLILHGNA